MDILVCAQCSLEIEGKGIHFRGQFFCSDECCEVFEEAFLDNSEPQVDDLADDDLDADPMMESDLGYTEDFGETDDLSDDDFDINPDDF